MALFSLERFLVRAQKDREDRRDFPKRNLTDKSLGLHSTFSIKAHGKNPSKTFPKVQHNSLFHKVFNS
jgi:hypothetical protein